MNRYDYFVSGVLLVLYAAVFWVMPLTVGDALSPMGNVAVMHSFGFGLVLSCFVFIKLARMFTKAIQKSTKFHI